MKSLKLWAAANNAYFLGVGLCLLMFAVYFGVPPVGTLITALMDGLNAAFPSDIDNYVYSPAYFTPNVLNTAAVKAVLLALVAMAQTVPVLTRGLDLVGRHDVHHDQLHCLDGCHRRRRSMSAMGVFIVLCAGAAAGFLNGAIVVYGRLQPIIVTLATGAVYYGIALSIRPIPGGSVDPTLADFVTGLLWGKVPTVLVLLLCVVLFIWIPFRRSVLGRGCYATGSAEGAAYLSGVAIANSKLAAYTLSGVFCAIAGLYRPSTPMPARPARRAPAPTR